MNIIFIISLLLSINHIICNKKHKQLPLCKDNEHIDGIWEYNSDINLKKNFRCCDWDTKDSNDIKECGNDNYNHGNFYNGSNLYYAHVGARACTCDQRDGTLHKITNRERYKWKPNKCRLLEWDGKDFCKLLGNRRILFVGASTMQQTSSTIMSMIKQSDGGCADQLIFTIDFHFSTKRDGDVAWNKVAERLKPDIVIITGGGHIRSLDAMEKLFDLDSRLGGPIKEIQSLFGDKMTLVWRTNQAGHQDCSPGVKANTPYNYIGYNEQYHLELQLEYDRVALDRVKKFGMKVIDMSPTYLRPDAHPHLYKNTTPPDCFHYCLPGPIDLSAVLLYQMLYNKEL